MTTRESRANARVPVCYPVTLTMLDETRLTGVTIDLSHGGICLHTDVRIRLAQYCAVRFDVPFDDAARRVLAMGQVIYCDPDGEHGFRIGVQFIKVDLDSVQVIGRLLAGAPD
jgi:hypothetical protein